MLLAKPDLASSEGEERLAASRGHRNDVRADRPMSIGWAMWEWFNEADPDEIKLLVSAVACFVGSITAVLLHYFYR